MENLAARNQFLAARTPLVFNQFGGALGGPVKRNKLFFFGVFEGYRQRAFRALNGLVPTQEFRDTAIRAVPAYRPFLERFPLPNTPVRPGDVTGTYNGAGSNAANDNHADARFDYSLNDHNLMTGRYSRGRPGQQIPRIPLNFQVFKGFSESGNFSFTHIRPTWTSESRFGYNLNDITRIDDIYVQGLAGINCCLGFSDGGEGLFKGGSSKSFEEIVALTRGRHSMKFGGIFIRKLPGRDNIESPAIQYPNVQDFLANLPSVVQVTWGVNPFQIRMWQAGFFAQDDFRVNRRLVVNLGLRYDFASVPNERDNRMFNRDGFFGYGPLRVNQRLYDADRNDFSPRLGFAWTVDQRAATVLRAGVGFFHIPHNAFGGPVETIRNALDEPNRYVFNRAEIIQYGLKYPVTNAATLPLVKNPNAPWAGTTINPNFPNPYSIQWTLSVQRKLVENLVLDTSYVATRGLKLNMVRDVNQINPATGLRPVAGFGTYRWYDTSDASSYHSWQTAVRKRFSSGLLFNVNYTWAKNLSFGDGDLTLPSSRPQDTFNIAADKGPSPTDTRQRFVSDFLYELPLLHLWSSASSARARLLLGGWQVGGVLNAATGRPLLIVQSSANPGTRPDYIGGQAVNSNYRETLQYLNPAAFARVPAGAAGTTARFGTLGRNAVYSPGSVNWDLSLSKGLAFTERWRLQIRADLFNALNHTNLSGVSVNIINANFGRLTSAGARVVQLNARLTF